MDQTTFHIRDREMKMVPTSLCGVATHMFEDKHNKPNCLKCREIFSNGTKDWQNGN